MTLRIFDVHLPLSDDIQQYVLQFLLPTTAAMIKKAKLKSFPEYRMKSFWNSFTCHVEKMKIPAFGTLNSVTYFDYLDRYLDRWLHPILFNNYYTNIPKRMRWLYNLSLNVEDDHEYENASNFLLRYPSLNY
jgi:hypothetical protein